MPRRRLTIAALMLMVLFIGLVAALVRSELENKSLHAQLAAAEAARNVQSVEINQILRDTFAARLNAKRPTPDHSEKEDRD